MPPKYRTAESASPYEAAARRKKRRAEVEIGDAEILEVGGVPRSQRGTTGRLRRQAPDLEEPPERFRSPTLEVGDAEILEVGGRKVGKGKRRRSTWWMPENQSKRDALGEALRQSARIRGR